MQYSDLLIKLTNFRDNISSDLSHCFYLKDLYSRDYVTSPLLYVLDCLVYYYSSLDSTYKVNECDVDYVNHVLDYICRYAIVRKDKLKIGIKSKATDHYHRHAANSDSLLLELIPPMVSINDFIKYTDAEYNGVLFHQSCSYKREYDAERGYMCAKVGFIEAYCQICEAMENDIWGLPGMDTYVNKVINRLCSGINDPYTHKLLEGDTYWVVEYKRATARVAFDLDNIRQEYKRLEAELRKAESHSKIELQRLQRMGWQGVKSCYQYYQRLGETNDSIQHHLVDDTEWSRQLKEKVESYGTPTSINKIGYTTLNVYENLGKAITFIDIPGEIRDTIVDLLEVEPSKITADADLTNDLGADSLDTVELLMRCEKEFGISIPDEESSSLYTVGDITEYIERILHDVTLFKEYDISELPTVIANLEGIAPNRH